MTHKQDAPSNDFPLPGWQVVEANGADAGAFLQAQLMNDVRAVAPGHWQWNGWLNPKGRMIALFALVALDANRFWMIAPDFPAADLAARMQRFVFRSKVKLAAREDSTATGAFAPPARAQRSAFDGITAIDCECIEFDLGSEGQPRTLRIATTQSPDGNQRHGCELAEQASRWLAFDLAHGLPRLSVDQSEAWTPQMLSLDRLNAYSLKKGCYPGQEIVARTHYLGQAKRGLVRAVGTGLQIGAEIRAGKRVLGTVVSCVDTEALAVLSTDRPAAGWECCGMACQEVALQDGLER